MTKVTFWISSLFVALIINCVFGQEFVNHTKYRPKSDPSCFHMSWLGSTYDEKKKINCSASEYKGVPCIKPHIISKTLPNVTDLWLDKKRTDIYCDLQEGYSCIKYTYTFNDKVANISYFCGKMIEGFDALDNGCFTQKIRGHVVEACACRSAGNNDDIMPCNLSARISYSLFIEIILLSLIYHFI